MEAPHKEEGMRQLHDPKPSTMLDTVRISGFRSLSQFELVGLPAACVVIGPNSCGKTNLIRFFEMLSHGVSDQGLGEYVSLNGGADAQLYCGHRITPQIRGEIDIKSEEGTYQYRFTLAHAKQDRLAFTEEAYRFLAIDEQEGAPWRRLPGGGCERAGIAEAASASGGKDETAGKIVKFLGGAGIYRFGELPTATRVAEACDMEDCRRLRPDGRNLAAVLYALEREYPRHYKWICRLISRDANDFERFHLESRGGKVRLRWKGKRNGRIYGPHETSDGTLRAFALRTLQDLPEEMLPNPILMDEPTLGIHYFALWTLGERMQSLTRHSQVLVTTQSASLLDEFDLEQTVVMQSNGAGTVARRFRNESFCGRTDEDRMATGDLYQRGYLGGIA